MTIKDNVTLAKECGARIVPAYGSRGNPVLMYEDQLEAFAARLLAEQGGEPTGFAKWWDVIGQFISVDQEPADGELEKAMAYAAWKVGRKYGQADTIATPTHPAPNGAPIDMILHCPACGVQHVDTAEHWGGTVEIHRSHLCVPAAGGCGYIWRPSDVPTNGVQSIKTRGKSDHPAPNGAERKALPAGYMSSTLTATPGEATRVIFHFDSVEEAAAWHNEVLSIPAPADGGQNKEQK